MKGATRDLDLARMRRERHAKLQAQLAAKGVDAAVLLTSGAVLYATGATRVQEDLNRLYLQRQLAVVVTGDDSPHLFTAYAEGAPPELVATGRAHAALDVDSDAGVEELVRRLKDVTGGRPLARVAVDDLTVPMHLRLRGLLGDGVEIVDAVPMLVAARLHKTPDEVECMRRSWEANEAATHAVEEMLRPGVRFTDMSGTFLRRFLEVEGTLNFLDPVWQAMPARIADGPWSTNGEIPFNLNTTDHIVSDGEVIWTDTVSGYLGYASDVGRTWVVGKPSPTLRSLARRWQDITDAVLDAIRPGVTGDVLTRIAIEANGGTKPWLSHFFLGHTLGLEGGEPQHIGSDKGQAADEAFVLEPGMAVVIEPVVWEEGHAGWRNEELVVVTDDGHERISRYPNTCGGEVLSGEVPG